MASSFNSQLESSNGFFPFLYSEMTRWLYREKWVRGAFLMSSCSSDDVVLLCVVGANDVWWSVDMRGTQVQMKKNSVKLSCYIVSSVHFFLMFTFSLSLSLFWCYNLFLGKGKSIFHELPLVRRKEKLESEWERRKSRHHSIWIFLIMIFSNKSSFVDSWFRHRGEWEGGWKKETFWRPPQSIFYSIQQQLLDVWFSLSLPSFILFVLPARCSLMFLRSD